MTKKEAKVIYRDLVQKAFNQEINRIKTFIQRAEARGYRFPSQLVEELTPKRVTLATVRKLRKITPAKLYARATAYDEERDMIISGTERRRQERKESARKAAETRKKNKAKGGITPPPPPKLGDIIYQRIMDMIDQARKNGKTRSADRLEQFLKDEIAEYGKDKVLRAMANAPEDMIDAADVALRYSVGSPMHESAIEAIAKLIIGADLTPDQKSDLNRAMSEDEDFDPDDYGYY